MKTIKLRKISYEQAKKEIKEYFKNHHGKKIDAADIQENLHINICDAIGILDVLEAEGNIEEYYCYKNKEINK